MSKTIESLIAHYTVDYDDEEREALIKMLTRAQGMSAQAQKEFVENFQFEPALDGGIYIATERSWAAKAPALLAEAESAGIRVLHRGNW